MLFECPKECNLARQGKDQVTLSCLVFDVRTEQRILDLFQLFLSNKQQLYLELQVATRRYTGKLDVYFRCFN